MKIDLSKAQVADFFTIARFPHQLRHIQSIKPNKQGNYDLVVSFKKDQQNFLVKQTFAKNGSGLGRFVNMKKFFYGEE